VAPSLPSPLIIQDSITSKNPSNSGQTGVVLQ
jgi:hypothetical protein